MNGLEKSSSLFSRFSLFSSGGREGGWGRSFRAYRSRLCSPRPRRIPRPPPRRERFRAAAPPAEIPGGGITRRSLSPVSSLETQNWKIETASPQLTVNSRCSSVERRKLKVEERSQVSVAMDHGQPTSKYRRFHIATGHRLPKPTAEPAVLRPGGHPETQEAILAPPGSKGLCQPTRLGVD